jgi:hypothetical protein
MCSLFQKLCIAAIFFLGLSSFLLHPQTVYACTDMYGNPLLDCQSQGTSCNWTDSCGNCPGVGASSTCYNGVCNCTSETATGCTGWVSVGGGWEVNYCDNNEYMIRPGGPTEIPPGGSGGSGGSGGGGGGPTDTPGPGGPTDTPLAGPTPTIPTLGDVKIVAKILPNPATCDALVASTQYLTGTQMTLNATTKTQDAIGTKSLWTLIQSSFPVTLYPPSDYAPSLTCWTYDLIPVPTTFLPYNDLTARVVGGQTLTGYIGFTIGDVWSQTVGGNVYAGTSITSKVPTTVPQTYFSLNGVGGYPGLVTYAGSLFDFSLALVTNGSEEGGSLSSTRWIANMANPLVSFYDHFTILLGGMTGLGDTWDTATGELTQANINGCVSSTNCYFKGNPTINDTISIGANEKKIIVIDGTLTIKNTIRVTSGGFFAVIAKGGITVDPTVGSTIPVGYAPGNTPHLQGIYITDGAFSVAGSGTPPDKQLILKGSVFANTFLLTRILSDANNVLYPATLFAFDPSLLFSMPVALQEVPFRWQEVAP